MKSCEHYSCLLSVVSLRGIPYISFLKQPELLKREVLCCSALCISTIFLLTNVGFNKSAKRRRDCERSPPGLDWSWDNLAGNEKVELSTGNIKIIIIICQSVIRISTAAQTGRAAAAKLAAVSQLFYIRLFVWIFQRHSSEFIKVFSFLFFSFLFFIFRCCCCSLQLEAELRDDDQLLLHVLLLLLLIYI